jgi:hypothetical protein
LIDDVGGRVVADSVASDAVAGHLHGIALLLEATLEQTRPAGIHRPPPAAARS